MRMLSTSILSEGEHLNRYFQFLYYKYSQLVLHCLSAVVSITELLSVGVSV